MTTKNSKVTDEISVSDLARTCFLAYELKDRQMIEDLLSDDFTFTSPLDDRIDRAEYFKRCWANSENIQSFQIEKLFENGNEVFVRYECETKAGKKFRNTEWFRFEGGKLKEVQVYFGEETRSADEVENQSSEIITQSKQASKPNSALKSLDKLVGKWKATDPSGAGAIDGQVTFEWMEGGNFLLQHIDFGDTKGIEIIGFDEESKSLKSHYFDGSGKILEYTYELHDDTLTVSINMPRAKGQFIAKFSDNDSTYTGSWNWTQDGVKKSYDAMMTRSK